MNDKYAIRNLRTGELVATYDNPITAELEIRAKDNPSEYEVAEKRIRNIYNVFPDGRAYIVGTESLWEKYEG